MTKTEIANLSIETGLGLAELTAGIEVARQCGRDAKWAVQAMIDFKKTRGVVPLSKPDVAT